MKINKQIIFNYLSQIKGENLLEKKIVDYKELYQIKKEKKLNNVSKKHLLNLIKIEEKMQLRKKIILMYLDHLPRETIIILSGQSEKC